VHETDTLKADFKRHDHPTYHGLNALRGVAAIAVAILHFSEGFKIPVPSSAYLAVDLFFAMSGFVIAYVYDPKFGAGMSVGSFMRARLIRFYPIYFIGLILAAIRIAGIALTHEPWAKISELIISLGFALAFLPAPIGRYNLPSLYPLNAPTWSLGVELVINALFGIFHRHLKTRVVIGIVLVAAFAFVGENLLGYGLGGADWASVHLGLLRGILSFGIGILLYRLRFRPRWLTALAPTTPFMLALLLALTFGRWQSTYNLVFILCLSPLLIIGASGKMPARSIGICTYLGRTSYPLYVLHMPVYILVIGVVKSRGFDLLDVALITLGVLLATSWYFDVLHERLRRYLNRGSQRPNDPMSPRSAS